jgi:hypothetical protein
MHSYIKYYDINEIRVKAYRTLFYFTDVLSQRSLWLQLNCINTDNWTAHRRIAEAAARRTSKVCLTIGKGHHAFHKDVETSDFFLGFFMEVEKAGGVGREMVERLRRYLDRKEQEWKLKWKDEWN